MKLRTTLLLVFALLLIVVVAVVFSILRHGISAHDEPTRVEAMVARTMRALRHPGGRAPEKESAAAHTGRARRGAGALCRSLRDLPRQ